MINLRIYRASLLLIAVAFAIAMFSLAAPPGERISGVAPEGFDGAATASLARSLAASAPDPTTGSDADEKLAEQVAGQFGQIAGAEVAVQKFGDGLQNVICVLPGETEDQVALLAGRDVTRGPGVASADASTAAMLETAASFGGTTHTKTLVFVSTDGAEGAEGAKRFAEGYSDIDRVGAALVISQPASREPAQPLLIPWSSGPQSTAVQLTETVRRAITSEADRVPAEPGPFSELTRLAIPTGLGDQAPLIESGIDAVRISSAGERPLPPADAQSGDISAEWLGRFGRAALSSMLALDQASGPLEHGPNAYIDVGGNLLPGWALSLIALSLIVPLAVVAVVALERAGRRPQRLLRGTVWVAGRAVPFAGALLVAYLCALVGLIATPAFPYDPSTVSLDTGGKIALVLIAAAFAAGLYLIRPWRQPPQPARRSAPAACAGLIALGAFCLWLANPYLALLAAPAFHAWLLLSAEETAVGSLLAVGLTLVGLIPLLAAIAAVGHRLGVGPGVGWQLLVLIGDGQFSFVVAMLGCLLVGCGLAALALARSRIEPDAPEPTVIPGG